MTARERVPISSSCLFIFSEVILFCCYQLPGAQLNPNLPILLTFHVSVERTFTVFPVISCQEQSPHSLASDALFPAGASDSTKTDPAAETSRNWEACFQASFTEACASELEGCAKSFMLGEAPSSGVLTQRGQERPASKNSGTAIHNGGTEEWVPISRNQEAGEVVHGL